MLVGVPREIKDNEFRVGLTPSTARELVEHGHKVIVQHGAGESIERLFTSSCIQAGNSRWRARLLAAIATPVTTVVGHMFKAVAAVTVAESTGQGISMAPG